MWYLRLVRMSTLCGLVLGLALVPAPAVASSCQLVLGFDTLASMIPSVVGSCLVDEHYNPQNGDGLQETSGGLLVWRKADNWTAFTDGYYTWINGPFGVEERLNAQRFLWEQDALSPSNPVII
jgi:hypothetical protein